MSHPVVDITLLSLKGIAFVDNKQSNPLKIPKLTAVVGFGGSARNMEVGTSMVCPRTGNLMVESHVACTLPRSSPNQQPLIARWSHGGEGAEVSSLEVDEEQQPHVSVALCKQDPRLPAMPVSASNRDSTIVQNISKRVPSIDLLETNSTFGGGREFPVDQGESIMWSQSDAAMPEIIELNVNLRVETDFQNHKFVQKKCCTSKESPSLFSREICDEESSQASLDSIYNIGIAHLVLFGNDGGTTLMDLPLKKLRKRRIDNIVVESNASIRIRVDVYPTGKKRLSKPKHSYLKSLPEASHLYEPNVLEPILRQLKLAEEMRRTKTQNQVVGKKSVPDRNKIFCGVFDNIFLSSRNEDEETLDLKCTSTMDSTIDTTPSMRSIW